MRRIIRIARGLYKLEAEVRKLELQVSRFIEGELQEAKRDQVKIEFVELFDEDTYHDMWDLGFRITRDVVNLQKEASFKKARKERIIGV